MYGYVSDPLVEIDFYGLAKLFQLGTYRGLNREEDRGDGLQAHELIRHEYLYRRGLAKKHGRLGGNPSIALDNPHHIQIGGAHWHERRIRSTLYNLGENEFHQNIKRELDITQGALRKAGVPASRARELRKESEKFYENLVRKKCGK